MRVAQPTEGVFSEAVACGYIREADSVAPQTAKVEVI
jgi:hypothetical protein